MSPRFHQNYSYLISPSSSFPTKPSILHFQSRSRLTVSGKDRNLKMRHSMSLNIHSENWNWDNLIPKQRPTIHPSYHTLYVKVPKVNEYRTIFYFPPTTHLIFILVSSDDVIKSTPNTPRINPVEVTSTGPLQCHLWQHEHFLLL